MCEMTFRKSQGHCEGITGITEMIKSFLPVVDQSDHLSHGKTVDLIHPGIIYICVYTLDKVSFMKFWLSYNLLCGPGWTLIHRDPIASASIVLGLMVCSWENLRD